LVATGSPETEPTEIQTQNNWARSFWSLIVTQFQGAFSDNLLKNLVLFLLVSAGLPKEKRDELVPIIGLLFAIPFVLFSMAGGYLADRYSKRTITIVTKVMEVVVTAVALFGLATRVLPIQLAAIFLISTQAALFGPSKYGLLPEILPEKKLSWGNGVLELGTFLAIITGTVAGGFFADKFGPAHQSVSGFALIALALLGLATSFGITRVPIADPSRKLRWNPFSELFHQIKLMQRDRALWLAVVGNTYFWFLGALLLSTVLIYGSDVLLVGPRQNGYLQATLAIGIGVGSLAAGYLSGNKIEYGLIPLGALGMTAAGAALAIPHLTYWEVAGLLAVIGGFAGFFAVPINALIQHRPLPEEKGGIIAATNLLSFVGIALASGAYYLLAKQAHLLPPSVFLVASLITLAGTIYILILLPDWFMRLLLWILTHTVYRIKVIGRDNIPERGGALFVCNHMSFVDACLLIASTDRPIRFLVFKDIYEMPLIKPFAKMMRAISISSQQRPRDMIRSLREASEAIRAGEVVCIFAEGQITRTGLLLPFRRGFERIMKGVEAPIVPIALDGVWGSIFSFERGRFLWKLPRKIPYPVTVSFGTPMAATSTAPEVRHAVQDLQSNAFLLRRKRMKTLDHALVRTARRHPMRFAMADGRVPKVRFGGVLLKSIFLARRLRKTWDAQEMVGILLPPSVAGALVNYAALLLGKVPVNLNYTASNEVMASCARQCNLKTVITTKALLERLPNLQVPGQTVFVEEVAAAPRLTEKLVSFLIAGLPFPLLKKTLGAKRFQLDDLATVIFSSGSTGDPKGVMLSHYNIGSNLSQMTQVFMLDRRDRVLGILPFFHSFGFTATLALPAAIGIGAVFHPSPLEARAVGALVAQYRITFLIATPTFLQAYIRRCAPEDFGSLQFVMVGAEKLPERVAQAFEDTFGIKPLEGYGCTECSPVVSVNTKDFRAAGFRQVGAKRGRIGHPLPGITVRVLDPETMQPVPEGTPGMLLVHGPNVMLGYLGRPEKTAEVLKDGWYTTGDIATLDQDGFLTITDRLSRFSKIGGEMVPHVKVEDKLHELAGVTEQTFAVAAVPDEKKGERLVVLHTLSEEKLAPVLQSFANCELPALWKPRPNQFFRVTALPMLGTGKIDLRGAKEQASKLSQASSTAQV
jgi:acyl-[acyl-carrier-protein]-phospholipid O-acyltransferase/long-chain-fatty-acid--[acyl-carrier-protein] ligase